MLAPSPVGFDAVRAPLGAVEAIRKTAEGVYLNLRGGGQLLLTGGAQPGEAMSVVLPMDGDFEVRLAAAAALHARLHSFDPGAGALTAQRRRRFRLMAQALDARAQGSSYREIASGVLGETFVDSLDWRTSATRDVVIRLCRGAAKLVRDGYLALLRRRS